MAKRLFIAVPIPSSEREKIRTFSRELEKALKGKANFVRGENLHVSIHFLGDVESERVEELKSALEGVAGSGTFNARLSAVGFFPSGQRVNVVWLGFSEGAEKLAGLHAETAKLPGLELEKRFVAHVTLARVKSLENRAEFVEKCRALERGLGEIRWAVDRVQLVESTLSSQGPAYEVLKEVLL